MKYLWVQWCAVVLGCAACSGQTNALPGAGRLLPVPHLQLRRLDETPRQTARTVLPGSGGRVESRTGSVQARELALPGSNHLNAAFEQRTLSSREGEVELAIFRRLDRAGYLKRPERPSDSAVVRWAEGTFRPKELHVGKTTITCSLYTALKRKNPLCLLNPLFFNMSW